MQCCCAACIRFGALFSRLRRFFLYCELYLRFRGCPVVLDIELFRDRMVSKDSTCTAARVFCCCCFLEQPAAACGINFKIACNGVKQINDFGAIRTPENDDFSRPTTAKLPEMAKSHLKHTRLKMQFFTSGNTVCTSKAAAARKGNTSDMPSVQPTEQSRTSPPGSRGSEHIPRQPSCGRLPECSVSPAMTAGAARYVLSKLEILLESRRIGPA